MAKIRIRLGDADRERLDCPEWMELDPGMVSMSEAIIMQNGTEREGVSVAFNSPEEWRAATNRGDAKSWLFVVWLTLRQNGRPVPLGELDFNYDQSSAEPVPDPDAPDEEAGKGEESVPATTS